MKNIATAAHQSAACNYFLALAEKEATAMQAFAFESSPWQFHRDRYVSLSNTAAQLMGDKTANPFI